MKFHIYEIWGPSWLDLQYACIACIAWFTITITVTITNYKITIYKLEFYNYKFQLQLQNYKITINKLQLTIFKKQKTKFNSVHYLFDI